jgi:uncharacterized protein
VVGARTSGVTVAGVGEVHDDDAIDEPRIGAGGFATWVVGVQAAMRGERDSEVPCGGCTACCTSSQFVHIEPDELETLAHIPAELLFPAPRAPRGHVLLGYDEHGHCPMLIEGGCSIYEHRPRTCRTYDCRIFAATGVAVADDQPAIAARVRRWDFTFPEGDDRSRHDAVRRATAYLREHRVDLGDDAPVHPTRLAVAATQVHDLFRDGREPHLETVRDLLRGG